MAPAEHAAAQTATYRARQLSQGASPLVEPNRDKFTVIALREVSLGKKRCLQQAIGMARKRQSKSLELRAATSLARLLAGAGRSEEARGALTEVYGGFTEGFDTADLKSARAVHDGL